MLVKSSRRIVNTSVTYSNLFLNPSSPQPDEIKAFNEFHYHNTAQTGHKTRCLVHSLQRDFSMKFRSKFDNEEKK